MEQIGFKFNRYDPCVANRMVQGKQQTVRFHVDDLMSSHAMRKVNDEFLKWLNKKYGKHGAVVATRGKRHDYLGMILDFSEKGLMIVDMTDYVAKMVDTFPHKLKKTDTALTPAAENLYGPSKGKPLDAERAQVFHTWTAKGLFVSKRGRMDIHPTVAGLCTRVQKPTESDWNRLVRMMKYLNGTRKDVHRMGAHNLRSMKWFVDAAFAVHPDFKSHTGGGGTMGVGFVSPGVSRKQKINTDSSTASELVGAHDMIPPIMWTRLFMEDQGYPLEKNILYQDNRSAILLEVNGRKSAGKRSRAMNIRYFFMTDQIEQGLLEVQYCHTDEMWADFMTKPLQGEKFRKFKKAIMGMD